MQNIKGELKMVVRAKQSQMTKEEVKDIYTSDHFSPSHQVKSAQE